jgi:hypothetical protein
MSRPDNVQTGHWFRVNSRITALSFSSGKRDAVLITENALLQLIAHACPDHEGMAHLTWESRSVLVFETDLIERTKPVHRPRSYKATA